MSTGVKYFTQWKRNLLLANEEGCMYLFKYSRSIKPTSSTPLEESKTTEVNLFHLYESVNTSAEFSQYLTVGR